MLTEVSIPAFTVQYACIFGISTALPGLKIGEHINSYSNGLCVITFHGKDGRIFWFILVKLKQRFQYPHTPRFSPDDAATFCEKLSTVRVWGNICVADLWKNKELASMTAVEEGLLQTWHFDRVVLLGDSVHKVNPSVFWLRSESRKPEISKILSIDDSKHWTRREYCGRRRSSAGFAAEETSQLEPQCRYVQLYNKQPTQ